MIYACLREYLLNLLEEIGMLQAKPVDSHVNPIPKLIMQKVIYDLTEGRYIYDLTEGRYRRLVEKSNYLTITRSAVTVIN